MIGVETVAVYSRGNKKLPQIPVNLPQISLTTRGTLSDDNSNNPLTTTSNDILDAY